LPKLGTDSEFLPIRNGVSWDWTKQLDGVSGTYASSDIRYSLDQRTWTEVTGQEKKGWLTGLMAGQKYYMGIRHVDAQGRKGIYSGNLGGIGPEVYTVTPKGGSAAAAPVDRRAPAATYRPYPEALMPYFAPLPEGEVIPREAVDIYPSIGDWTGSPAPTYRWKIRRNGTDITPYQPFTSDYDNNWAGVSKYTRTQADFSDQPKDTWLEVVVEARNASGRTEAISPRIYMPQRATLPSGMLIDTGFTESVRLDYPEIWNNLTIANGSLLLSNGFYNQLASDPGYIFNSKDGSSATLRIRTQEIGRTGARYRINAQIIIGTAGRTRASIRAGDTISRIATYPAGQSPKVVTIKDYIHTVPAAADGEKINFDLLLSRAGGRRGGDGLGIINLKIERL
jgi:hypothetical protein